MLAGVVVLVLAHRAGLTFLILFLSCTTLMVVLMVWLGHNPHEPVRRRRGRQAPGLAADDATGSAGEGELVDQHLEPVGGV